MKHLLSREMSWRKICKKKKKKSSACWPFIMHASNIFSIFFFSRFRIMYHEMFLFENGKETLFFSLVIKRLNVSRLVQCVPYKWLNSCFSPVIHCPTGENSLMLPCLAALGYHLYPTKCISCSWAPCASVLQLLKQHRPFELFRCFSFGFFFFSLNFKSRHLP